MEKTPDPTVKRPDANPILQKKISNPDMPNKKITSMMKFLVGVSRVCLTLCVYGCVCSFVCGFVSVRWSVCVSVCGGAQELCS